MTPPLDSYTYPAQAKTTIISFSKNSERKRITSRTFFWYDDKSPKEFRIFFLTNNVVGVSVL